MMKKIMILTAATVLTLGMTSCKKDYTCTCTFEGESESYNYSNVKKSDAEDACDTQQQQYSNFGVNAACSI